MPKQERGRVIKGGYTKKLIWVDLTNRTTKIRILEEELLERFIGGVGLGTKFLFEELRNRDPFSPEAPLIIMTGPLTGTIVPTSGRVAIVAMSPGTFSYGESDIGGRPWTPIISSTPEFRKATVEIGERHLNQDEFVSPLKEEIWTLSADAETAISAIPSVPSSNRPGDFRFRAEPAYYRQSFITEIIIVWTFDFTFRAAGFRLEFIPHLMRGRNDEKRKMA